LFLCTVYVLAIRLPFVNKLEFEDEERPIISQGQCGRCHPGLEVIGSNWSYTL